MPKLLRSFLLAGAVGILAGAGVLAASDGADAGADAEKSASDSIKVTSLGKAAAGIQVAEVERVSRPMEISVPGKIEVIPTMQFDTHAPLSGRVSVVSVSPGQVVRAGQTLAIVNSPEMNQLAAQLLQSKVDTESEYASKKAALDEEVRQAEEKLKLAQANFERVEKLFELKIAPQKDALQAKADISLAQTRIKTARQNREIMLKALAAKINLVRLPIRQRLNMLGVDDAHIETMLRDQTTLTSVPVCSARSGVVLTIAASAGKSIDPTVSLFTIADLSKVWATADVYEDDMASMKEGEKVKVKVHGIDGPPVQGVLTYIGNEVDPQTRTLPVRAELINPALTLKPDMFAELYIQTADSRPVITLPRDAVVNNALGNVVFVEAKDGYQAMPVKLGRSFGDNVEIVDGLKIGQRVVVRGAFELGAELVKAQGGEALFAQPTEGERMQSDSSGAPGGLNISVQLLIASVAAAFILGFGISAVFLLRANRLPGFGSASGATPIRPAPQAGDDVTASVNEGGPPASAVPEKPKIARKTLDS